MQQTASRSSRFRLRRQELEDAQVQVVEPVEDEYDELVDDPRDVEGEEEEKRKTSRKRCKTKHEVVIADKSQEPSPFRNVRGRRGFLQYMKDMPLDIVYEIFGKLKPIDLLYLSWSCKIVRAIVMDRHAKFLWSQAYQSLEIQPPPCPSDLNYAQYTRFLFVNRCMVCQVATASSAHYSWELRLKVCQKCLESDYFVSDQFLQREFTMHNHGIRTRGRRTYYLRSDYMRMLRNPQARVSHVGELDRKGQDQGLYNQWRRDMTMIRYESLSQRRETRVLALFEKLAEIGWQKEKVLEYVKYTRFRRIDNLPTFQRSSKLTRGEWAKICPEIISILEEGRLGWQREHICRNGEAFATTFKQWYEERERIRKSDQAIAQTYYGTQSQNPDERFKATPFDFMVHEPFLSSILNCDDDNAVFPLDEETSSRFAVLHAECLRKRQKILFNLLPNNMKQRAMTMDDPYQILHLASIWFCDSGTPIDYFTALHIIRTPYLLNETNVVLWDLQERFGGRSIGRDVSFNHKAHDLAKYFIQASGNDPNTTTDMELFEYQDIVFRCVNDPEEYIWSALIKHSMLESTFLDDQISEKLDYL